jgi:hypothetical protein
MDPILVLILVLVLVLTLFMFTRENFKCGNSAYSEYPPKKKCCPNVPNMTIKDNVCCEGYITGDEYKKLIKIKASNKANYKEFPGGKNGSKGYCKNFTT